MLTILNSTLVVVVCRLKLNLSIFYFSFEEDLFYFWCFCSLVLLSKDCNLFTFLPLDFPHMLGDTLSWYLVLLYQKMSSIPALQPFDCGEWWKMYATSCSNTVGTARQDCDFQGDSSQKYCILFPLLFFFTHWKPLNKCLHLIHCLILSI